MRHAWVVFHRYVGLVMAAFLLIAGVTGALLVWYHELDQAINPRLMIVSSTAENGTPLSRLDPLALRERVQAAYPQAWVHWVPLAPGDPVEAHTFWIQGAPDARGVRAELGVDEVFVNPYTGAILGAREWGHLSDGITNLMPFLYRLHHSLALGTVGTWVFGVIAVLWTVDCFVGAWLTFPLRARNDRTATRGWWRRWAPAWKLRWHGGPYRVNFDLHRAGGLWPWAMLLVLAWSSVAFNLYDSVYKPVMATLLEFKPDPRESLPRLEQPEPEPAMGWAAALSAARGHVKTLEATKGWQVRGEDRVSYDPRRGVVRLEVRTDRDISDRRARSAVFVDGRTGELMAHHLPTGEAAGDTITAWLLTLHLTHIWGLPFRLLVTAVGVGVAILSVTGVYIWWRKRQGRRSHAAADRFVIE